MDSGDDAAATDRRLEPPHRGLGPGTYGKAMPARRDAPICELALRSRIERGLQLDCVNATQLRRAAQPSGRHRATSTSLHGNRAMKAGSPVDGAASQLR
jgi:hypothetical protein